MSENTEKVNDKQDKTRNIVVRNEKGQIIKGTPNPAGRPKGTKNFTTKVREALNKFVNEEGQTFENQLAEVVVKKAMEGDKEMIKLIWNYMDGMPTQKIESKNWNDILKRVYDAPNTQLPEDSEGNKVEPKQLAEESGAGQEQVQDNSSRS